MSNNKNDSIRPNVLFIWKVDRRLKEHLQDKLSDCPVNLVFTETDNYLDYAANVDVIVGWRPSEELLNTASNLKLYINPGAGVQHLLRKFRAIKDRKITLVNGHGNSYFTAQHIVAMLLSLTNKIIPHHNWMQNGHWRLGDAEAQSIPLRDKTIGLLGYGNINKKVHKFLSVFDLSFAILRRNWNKDNVGTIPTSYKRFDINSIHDFMKLIDILIIALPMTEETENMIGPDEIRLLGKDGILINAGRGPIVNEKALYNALKNKSILSAAIDVWYDYHPKPDEKNRRFPTEYPFHKLDNVLLSPHRAASPINDLKRWDDAIENIRRFATGKEEFLNIVDIEQGY